MEVTEDKGGFTMDIMQIAPVPMFTVWDGLKGELHAVEVHRSQRSLTDSNHTEVYIQLTKT